MKVYSIIFAVTAFFGAKNAQAQCMQRNLANGQYLREATVGFQPGSPNWKSVRCYCDAGHQMMGGGCDVTPEKFSYVTGTFTSSIPVVQGDNTLGWLCQLNYHSDNLGGKEALKVRILCKP